MKQEIERRFQAILDENLKLRQNATMLKKQFEDIKNQINHTASEAEKLDRTTSDCITELQKIKRQTENAE